MADASRLLYGKREEAKISLWLVCGGMKMGTARGKART
jgi:hypothetical protein